MPVVHYPQGYNYYCGPAAGKMILMYMNEGNSEYTDHLSLSQTSLATDNYMQTDRYHETSWAAGRFKFSLNRWHSGSPHGLGWYVDEDTPSASEFESDVEFDAYHGHPLGISTVELSGGAHYNGHPKSSTIGHWIVSEGYYGNGSGTYFDDPATSVWDTVSANFSYDTSDFANRFLQSNGIVW